ncbi:Concanavalin A-like lectin/glucanases superfamily [Penicillium vulpinum]|uniref:Concanavalin A-like lectin/glucanases superfamily n=1 Tax=Penicillium vulpinum TaxID=29845 RepID=UPI002546B886|nr:Concanavalin A-like lectin/glucanases superfamily [Penicillium vulpinum]KAJ5951606.1 Concanavalin A-like lectin/glucanases superfamily [Penicillium vulpinum]
MKFTKAILTTTILAGSSLAAPGSGLVERLQGRGALSRQSSPAEKKGILLKQGAEGGKVQYSKNWAGVVRENPPARATYTAVSATFTVPEPTATNESGEMQAVSAWVGIDGDTYTDAILQTGIDAYIQNGQQTFDAWYEWYPLSAENFDLQLSAGDVVVAKVETFSTSKGAAIIENKSTGQRVTKTLSAPSTSATIAGQNAEWIVEDFNTGNNMVPLANFGKVDFTGAQAEAGGVRYGTHDAAVLHIQQNGNVKAHVRVPSETEFSVTYQ